MEVEVEQRPRRAEDRLEACQRRDLVQPAVQVGEDAREVAEVPWPEDLLHLRPVHLLEDEIGTGRVVERGDREPVCGGVTDELGLFRRGAAVPMAPEHPPVAEIEDVGVPSGRDEPHERH